MTHKTMKHIFNGLSVAALLLAAACTDISELNYDQPNAEVTAADADGIVNIRIKPQTQAIASRADDYWKHGEGSLVDVLIFAVYRKKADEGNDKYTLQEYHLATDKNADLKAKANEGKILLIDKDGNPLRPHGTFPENKVGPYQMAVPFDKFSECTLSIKVVADSTYQVVFWAQNSSAEMFDTKDLTKVLINYGGGKNNDEFRDAFCATTGEFSTNNANSVSATLTRPFSQINIGTAGWDYEGAAVLKPAPVSYNESKVTISGVADIYNVLGGYATKSSPALLSITFDYAKIPAFQHVTDDEWNKAVEDNVAYRPFTGKEHFMQLDLNHDGKINPTYLGWDEYKEWSKEQTDNKNAAAAADPESDEAKFEETPINTLTEEFKHLSMCYVLVPFGVPSLNDDNTVDPAAGGVLNSLTFQCQGSYIDDNGDPQTVIYDGFTIKNVPVQHNWRTNIVSFDLFTARSKFLLYVVPEYCGDFTNMKDADFTEKEWSDKWNKTNIVERDSDGKYIVKDNEDGTHGTPNPDFKDYNKSDNSEPSDPGQS